MRAANQRRCPAPLRLGFALLIAGALLSACGGGDDAAPRPDAKPPAAPAPSPAPAPAPAPVPKPETAAPPQVPSDPGAGDAAAGAPLYAQNCSNCHGTTGAGDGPMSAGLVPKPARHNDGAYMNALSNEHLFKVIKEGGASVGKSPLMAPWGPILDDEQIVDVIAYIRSLAKPPYRGG